MNIIQTAADFAMVAFALGFGIALTCVGIAILIAALR